MDLHPFLNHAKFVVFYEQLVAWDIFSLYLNTYFSMALVAFIPCMSVVWGFITAPNKLSLLSVLKSISFKTRICAYPVFYPILTYAGFLPFLVVGWFPLLVSSLKICEVLITSPATFPWLSYASRNKSGHLYALEGARLFDFNFVDAAHSAAMNPIWVQYEPYKNILLQNLDFVVCNYVLLCSTLLLWSNVVFYYEAVLYIATYGKPRNYTQWEVLHFRRFSHGPFLRAWMYFTMNKDGRFPYWVPRYIEVIIVYGDNLFFSPWAVLLFWLPIVSALHVYEIYSTVAGYSNLLVDDPRLEKVFELLKQHTHEGGSEMYPIYHFVNGYMEYVHGFWKMVGWMM